MFDEMSIWMCADFTLNLRRGPRWVRSKPYTTVAVCCDICRSCLVQSCYESLFEKFHRVWPPMYSTRISLTERIRRL